MNVGTFDATVVVPFHKEGTIAETTLRGLAACVEQASCDGTIVEVVCVLDSADNPTTGIVKEWCKNHAWPSPIHCTHSDLGLARNTGVEHASSEIVVFVDGDDLVSPNFIMEASKLVSANRCTIFHPEFNARFGNSYSVTMQVGSTDKRFKKDSMLRANPWSACAAAHKSVLNDIPYRSTDFLAATGFEDWLWNCDTIAAGYQHEIITGTVYFARDKASGSLSRSTSESGAVIARTRLFQ